MDPDERVERFLMYALGVVIVLAFGVLPVAAILFPNGL